MVFCQQVLGEDAFPPLARGFPLGQVVSFQLHSGEPKIVRSIPLDIFENDKGYFLKADLPGVDKQHIKLDVEKDVLSLSVQQQQQQQQQTTQTEDEEKDQTGAKWHRTERSSTYKKRTIKLPEDADMDNIQAKYENGVLTVEIAKTEIHQKQRQVTIA